MHCSFCSIAAFYRLGPGRPWRTRRPESVAEEVEAVLGGEPMSSVGADYIWFAVDEFVGPKQKGDSYAGRLAKELLRRQLKLRFEFDCRADQISAELFALLKQAGLRRVYVGIESFSQEDLDCYDKKTRAASNVRALLTLKRLGIDFTYGLIAFTPDMTFERFAFNHEMAKRFGYHRLTEPLCRLKMFRGTSCGDAAGASRLIDIARHSTYADLCEVALCNYGFADDRVALLWKALSGIDEENQRIVDALIALYGDGLLDLMNFWRLCSYVNDTISAFIDDAMSLVKRRATNTQIDSLRQRHREVIEASLENVRRFRDWLARPERVRPDGFTLAINGWRLPLTEPALWPVCTPGHERDIAARVYERDRATSLLRRGLTQPRSLPSSRHSWEVPDEEPAWPHAP